MLTRCPWVPEDKPDYIAYHDDEWGQVVLNDQTIFEFLCLESAQAGLSWYTVLKKRDNYRRAFANFDAEQVARFDEQRVTELMADAGIIRNQLKIRAAINNAQRFLDVQQQYGSFAKYIWQFVDNRPMVNQQRLGQPYPATNSQSDALAKDLKKRGFKFLGSTVCYAHMQASGMINDHCVECGCYQPTLDSYPRIDWSVIDN